MGMAYIILADDYPGLSLALAYLDSTRMLDSSHRGACRPWPPKRSGVGGPTRNPSDALGRNELARGTAPDAAMRYDAPWGFLAPSFGYALDGARNDMSEVGPRGPWFEGCLADRG